MDLSTCDSCDLYISMLMMTKHEISRAISAFTYLREPYQIVNYSDLFNPLAPLIHRGCKDARHESSCASR